MRIEVDEYCEKNKQLLMDVKSKEHEILDLKRSNIDFERVKLSQEKQIENQSVTIQRYFLYRYYKEVLAVILFVGFELH